MISKSMLGMEDPNTLSYGLIIAVINSRTATSLLGVQCFFGNSDSLAYYFNFFAPGHGKGICDSEGGISKHAVANAALYGDKLNSPYDLYVWLKANAVEVTSKTVNALHSPDEREYHYFSDNQFLDYHPVDVHIDRINCYYAFCISRNTPLRLFSRYTSCFCESCKLGNFSYCIDQQFHGEYHVNDLDITLVEHIPDHIDLGMQMRGRLLDLRASYTKPFVVMLFERQNIWRPTFALISPGANFNIATVHAHILEQADPNNYFNNTVFKISKGTLCNRPNHACPKQHTQLIRFDKICCICLQTTPAGSVVNAIKLVHNTDAFWLYDFKETYAFLLEDYKKTRVQVFGNYRSD
jgi:hypothetical protein